MTTIGLDLGGTWAKAWVVKETDRGLETHGGAKLERWNVTGFRALKLETQLAGSPAGAKEAASAEALVQAAATVVMAAAKGLRQPLDLAVATAGLKTEDGRGIALWRRGPRVPNLLDILLARLKNLGFRPRRFPTCLFDDSRAAATGELVASCGTLSTTQEAFYIGPGTGVAEAYISTGNVTPWPATMLPAYAEKMVDGSTFGDAVSLSYERGFDASFAALGSLIRLRIEQLRAASRPPLERVVIGAKGGERLSREPHDGQLYRSLAMPFPVTPSDFYASAAVGAVALERRAGTRD